MYINYWPPIGDRVDSSAVPPGVSTSPLSAAWLDRARSRINSIGESAARGFIAAQTVAPDMPGPLANSTGSGTPTAAELSAGRSSAFDDAPRVLPMNDAWRPPERSPSPCPSSMVNAGPPWSDGLYSVSSSFPVGSGGVLDWIKAHPLVALLVVGAGAAGLSYLGSNKRA